MFYWRIRLKKLMNHLEITLLHTVHKDPWLIPRKKKNQLQPRIHSSQCRTYMPKYYRMLDSRSGVKGKTIRKRLGK